jgi:hypothetical protein
MFGSEDDAGPPSVIELSCTTGSHIPGETEQSPRPAMHRATCLSTTSIMPDSEMAAVAPSDATNPPVPLAELSTPIGSLHPTPSTWSWVQTANSGFPPRTTRHVDGDTPAVSEQPTTSSQTPASLNKYELSIFPDEHSIVDDPLLRCTPYIINSKHMVLICTDCRHCVNPDRMTEHLRKHHSHCKVGTDFTMQVTAKFRGLVNEAIHPPEVIEPVFGLAIPIEKYTVCARCRRGYLNISTWRRHACGKTDVDLGGCPEHFPSFVQSFFRGPNICYFPIKPPASLSDEACGDDFDLFNSGFQELTTSEDDVSEPEDYRELNQFLLKEGWIRHLSGCSRSELSLLIAPPREDEVLQPVAHEVIALMSNIQAAIGMAGYHVRRLLGRRPV